LSKAAEFFVFSFRLYPLKCQDASGLSSLKKESVLDADFHLNLSFTKVVHEESCLYKKQKEEKSQLFSFHKEKP